MKEEYVDYLLNQVKLKPHDVSLSSNRVQQLQCLVCNETFKAAPKGKVNNFKKHGLPGCKKCTHKKKHADNQQKHLSHLEENYEILKLPKEVGALVYNDKVTIRRKDCGHSFSSSWYNIKGATNYCPECNKKIKSQRCKELNEIKHNESIQNYEGFEKYKKIVKKLTNDNYKKYKNIINPDNFERVLSGRKGYHLDHIISVKNCYLWGIPEEICSHHENLRLIPWKENITKNSNITPNIPHIFLDYIELSSNAFIASLLSNNVFTNNPIKNYKISNKNYVSLMFKNKQLAVYFADFNNVRQQIGPSKYYLDRLRKECVKNGYDLLVFFEDEWIHKPELVINKIKHSLTELDNTRIFARKCKAKKIDNDAANKFLRKYHLQGSVKHNYSFGLYYNNDLTSVMTFTEPRKQMSGLSNSNNANSIELSRFCTHSDFVIVGGASKLLSAAIPYLKDNNKTTIFSFADLRLSKGVLYEQLGFTLSATNKPSYKYIIDKERKHRWGYRKSLIKERFPDTFDPTKTEYQNMLEVGIDRVWDCGYLKYCKEI